jgi:hypothetical protein
MMGKTFGAVKYNRLYYSCIKRIGFLKNYYATLKSMKMQNNADYKWLFFSLSLLLLAQM